MVLNDHLNKYVSFPNMYMYAVIIAVSDNCIFNLKLLTTDNSLLILIKPYYYTESQNIFVIPDY